MSTSFLGMVERGETDLSLARFTRLTGFLGISIADLLEEDPAPKPPRVQAIPVAPAVDRGDGVDYRVIHRDHPQLIAVTLAPGAAFADMRSHRGEDIWIVVAGRATFMYGAGRYPAEAGNIVSFPGIVAQGWRTRLSSRLADRRLQRVVLVMTGSCRILAGAAPVAPKALVRPFAMRYIAGPRSGRRADGDSAAVRRGATATVDVLGEQLRAGTRSRR